MASNKWVDSEGVKSIGKYYKDQLDKKVAVEAGKGLIETEKVTKLDGIEASAQVNKIEEIDVNGTPVSIVGKKVDITAEVLAPDLADYAKTADIEGTYAKTEDLATYATKAEIAKLGTIKGTCLKEDLETKKEGAAQGDCWVVTDDGNHIHYYGGEDFIDCGSHIDLSGYAKTEALSAYATTTAMNEALSAKADTTALESYLLKTELPEALSDEEITGLLKDPEPEMGQV